MHSNLVQTEVVTMLDKQYRETAKRSGAQGETLFIWEKRQRNIWTTPNTSLPAPHNNWPSIFCRSATAARSCSRAATASARSCSSTSRTCLVIAASRSRALRSSSQRFLSAATAAVRSSHLLINQQSYLWQSPTPGEPRQAFNHRATGLFLRTAHYRFFQEQPQSRAEGQKTPNDVKRWRQTATKTHHMFGAFESTATKSKLQRDASKYRWERSFLMKQLWKCHKTRTYPL